MSTILAILAHCDDEVIFGFPIMQYNIINNIYLLTLTNNKKYNEGPEKALREVCHLNKINLLELPRLEPNFYRLPPRYDDYVLPNVINLFNDNIKKAIDICKPDYIFTHNPMGEYGHGDHRMVFNLVSMFDTPLMITDICFSNACHLSSDGIPAIYKNYLYNKALAKEKFTLKLSWYNTMKTIYEEHKAWSWSGHEPVLGCNLFTF